MLQNVRNQLLPCLDGGRLRGRRELSAPVLRSHSMPIRFTEEHQRYLGEVENEREDHPMRRLPMSESAKAAAVASMERQQQVRGCMAFIRFRVRSCTLQPCTYATPYLANLYLRNPLPCNLVSMQPFTLATWYPQAVRQYHH